VTHVDVAVVIATIALTLVIFFAFGMIGTAIVLAFQQGGALIIGFTALLALVSGVLYPVAELPGWVQPLVHLSPLTYTLELLRSALLANQPPTSYTQDLLILLAFAVILLPLSGILLETGFRYSQRRATLSTF
jgi:ABC-type polysaccharide/polyol phosphate export permease